MMQQDNAKRDAPIIVRCDECRQEGEAVFKTRKFGRGRGLHETYLECEICHAKSTSFITNPKVRKLQKESHNLRMDKFKTEVDTEKLKRNYENIEKTMDELLRTHGR